MTSITNSPASPSNSPISSQKCLLFRNSDSQPLMFFLHQDVFGRQSLKADIETNGGKIVNTLGFPGCIPIFDHMKKPDSLNKYISYKWITDSLKAGKLLNMEPYQIDGTASRTTISWSASPQLTSAPKYSRAPFTKEEDELLINSVTSSMYASQGMKLFERIAQDFPSHTAQSWRARWVKVLKPLREKDVSESMKLPNTPSAVWTSPGRTQHGSMCNPKETCASFEKQESKENTLQEPLGNEHFKEVHISHLEVGQLAPNENQNTALLTSVNQLGSDSKKNGNMHRSKAIQGYSEQDKSRKKRKLSIGPVQPSSPALDEADKMSDELLSRTNSELSPNHHAKVRQKKNKYEIWQVPSTPDRVVDSQTEDHGISLEDPPFVEIVNKLWAHFCKTKDFGLPESSENKENFTAEDSSHSTSTEGNADRTSHGISNLPEDEWITDKARKYQVEEIEVVKALFCASGNINVALIILAALTKGQAPPFHPQIWTDEEDMLIRQGDLGTLKNLDRLHKGQLEDRRRFLEKFDQEM